MKIKDILDSATNTQDYSIKYSYNNVNYVLAESSYVKYTFIKYNFMEFLTGESITDFNNYWVNYVNGVMKIKEKYFSTLLNKLYSLEGESIETWSGTKTNTRTNNLKDSTNTDMTNTVTDNTKSSTNTDIKNTRKEPTYESNGLNTVDETSESGNKSNNYVENTGTTTTTNIGTKNNNYIEKTGTITDVESYTNYTHTTTNTETDYLVFAKFLEKFDIETIVNDIIETFVFENCYYAE